MLPSFNISFSFLAASLLWGSLGTGFVIYGKRQSSMVPFIGGLALIGISYFASDALKMSLLGALILAGMWFFRDALQ